MISRTWRVARADFRVEATGHSGTHGEQYVQSGREVGCSQQNANLQHEVGRRGEEYLKRDYRETEIGGTKLPRSGSGEHADKGTDGISRCSDNCCSAGSINPGEFCVCP
jgi:hypothetical protein